jgi:lysophospholipase L1-like esterase
MNIKMLVLLAALATSFTATGSATAGPDSAKCALAKGGARVHGCWRPRAATTTRNGDPGQAHYYLSLGDSLAQGFQPNGDLSDGYADQLYASLHSGDSKLVLAKLGCGGETTATMIDASLPYEGRGASHFCGFPHGSQLAEAISFLRAHRGFVSLVTTDIGANDILTSAGVSTIEANLLVILAQLRDAAGPDVPIVGMTDYDPFLAEVWFSSFDLAALQQEARAHTVNGALEDIYRSFGDPIAEVDQAFSNNDTTIQPDGLPLDVDRICQWTWTCALGDIHPDTQGYAVIAAAFERVLPESGRPRTEDLRSQHRFALALAG